MYEAYSEEERKPVMCTQLNESFIRLLLHSLCLHSLVSDMYFYATLCLFSDSTMFFNLTFVLGPAVQFSLALNMMLFFPLYVPFNHKEIKSESDKKTGKLDDICKECKRTVHARLVLYTEYNGAQNVCLCVSVFVFVLCHIDTIRFHDLI